MLLLASYTQLLRVMRITAVLLLIGFIHVSAAGFGQNVTLSFRDVPVSTILQEIIKQTHISIVYDKSEVNKNGPISIEVNNQPIEEVLNRCFKDQAFTYELVNNMIVVKAKRTLYSNDTPPIDVHGQVVDSLGNPLAGASVSIKGTNKGTVTDSKGDFDLKDVHENQTLIISFTGFEKREVKVMSSLSYRIELKRSSSPLDQVQVIAYGTTTKRFNTGDVTTITSKEIEQQPVSNVLAALEGRVPGLLITQTTGVPGGAYTAQIRGQNSIANGNDPYYIIDGVPYISQAPVNNRNGIGRGGSPLNFINPGDIDRIEILKDADATAIYGSRGANGVILITTKKGKAGRPQVTLGLYSGIGQVSSKVDYVNTPQYLEMRNEAFKNDGATPDPSVDFDLLVWDTTRYTDWQKSLIGGTAHYTDAQASISGGNSNANYLFGGSYRRETTVFPGDSKYENASAYFSINTISINQKFKTQFSGSFLTNSSLLPATDPAAQVQFLSPDAPPAYNIDGSLNWANSTWLNGNPYSYLEQTYEGHTTNLISNALLSYELISGLELKTSLGYTNMNINETQVNPTTSYDPAFDVPASTSFYTGNVRSWIIEPQLNYKLDFSKSHLSALVGSTFQENVTETQVINATGFNGDQLLESLSAATSLKGSTINSQYKYNAIFAKIYYNLKDKYLLNLTGRRDGSSRFGPGNQFSNFGAVGAAWIFSSETFVRNNLPFLSFGKLRASYGTSGNDQIGDYRYLDLYNALGVPYQNSVGLSSNSLFNPNLAWELIKKFEVGLDLGLLKDRIIINASYYLNKSSNQLVSYPLSEVTGFTTVASNLPAVVQNSGLELFINSLIIKTKDFSWSSSINLTINSNKLVSYPNLSSSVYKNSYIVGQSTSIKRLYHSVGVNDSTGVYQFLDSKGNTTYDPVFPDDLSSYVNIAPKYYGGFQNTVQYKGISLDFLFQFVKKISPNYLTFLNAPPGSEGINQPVFVLNRWQNIGDNKPIERFNQDYSLYNSWTYASQSNLAYSDGSFIRLKNVSLSYNFPETWNQKMHVKAFRVYFQGQNLLTFTKYLYFDPESLSSSSIPPLRVYTLGFQMTL